MIFEYHHYYNNTSTEHPGIGIAPQYPAFSPSLITCSYIEVDIGNWRDFSS